MLTHELYACFNETPENVIDARLGQFVLDSRIVSPGDVFVAMKGSRVDGYDKIEEALSRGAGAIIAERAYHAPVPVIVKENIPASLIEAATRWRLQLRTKIIGITGSNGKTTVKNMTASLLAELGSVYATPGNLNNHLGLPISLLSIQRDHIYAVLEMGMNHLGEISTLTEIAKPDVAVITMVTLCHAEGTGSLDAIAKAKGEIIQGVPFSGTVVLNHDDPYFQYWTSLLNEQTLLSFGWESNADVYATLHKSEGCQQFTLHNEEGDIEISLPFIGKHNVTNALAATTAAMAISPISLPQIREGLLKAHREPGRMIPHQISDDLLVIDDAYNANPASTKAAIDTLMQLPGKKVLVFGDMGELGAFCDEEHEKLGEYAKSVGLDCLIAAGQAAEKTVLAFGRNGHHFESVDLLIENIPEYLDGKTTVLVKGSRFMNMTRVVKALQDIITIS